MTRAPGGFLLYYVRFRMARIALGLPWRPAENDPGESKGSVKSSMKRYENGESVNENGDENGLRVEILSIVHQSRRRYRQPKWTGKRGRKPGNGHPAAIQKIRQESVLSALAVTV